MTLTYKLLVVLADGKWHSGEYIGVELGVTRAAIWKQIQVLSGLGLSVDSVKGLGYCLKGGVSLLCQERVERVLRDQLGRNDLHDVDLVLSCLDVIESTNKVLLSSLSEQKSIHQSAVFAEGQTAGRGRRAREWHSPYAQNIYFSLGWHFSGGIAALQGLSLAVSVAVANALNRAVGIQVDLKWPNDILHNGKKLGGILLELGGDLSGDCAVVVGIGLNVNMLSDGNKIDQPWVSLRELSDDAGLVDRNALLGIVLAELSMLMSTYPEKGFVAYQDAWESFCPHVNHAVSIISGNKEQCGVMRGVSVLGELILDRSEYGGSSRMLIHGGEVSLRAT